MKDHEYESEVYDDVVIRNKPFKGWTATYVGCGRMRFVHQEHGEFRVNKGLSNCWMRECWGDFIEFVNRIETKATQTKGDEL